MSKSNSIHIRLPEDLYNSLMESFEKVKGREVRTLSEHIRDILEAYISEGDEEGEE